MKRLRILLAIVAAVMIVMPAAGQSIDDAVASAKSSGKKVLLIFYSSSDSWSKKLEQEVMTYQAAIGEMANYAVVKIDGDANSRIKYGGKENSFKDISSLFSVTGYPSFVFLNSDGSPISFKYDGESVKSLSGYLGADDFVNMLKYFSQNKFTDTDLSTMLGN